MFRNWEICEKKFEVGGGNLALTIGGRERVSARLGFGTAWYKRDDKCRDGPVHRVL